MRRATTTMIFLATFAALYVVGAKAAAGDDMAHHLQRAEAGNASSQFWLGVAYEGGKAVPQNYAEAITWYRKSEFQFHRRNAEVPISTGEGESRLSHRHPPSAIGLWLTDRPFAPPEATSTEWTPQRMSRYRGQSQD